MLAHLEVSHAGHSHNILGSLVEKFLDIFSMNDTLKECLEHIIVDSVNVFALLIAIMFIVFLATGYVHIDRLQKKLASLKSIWGFLLAIFLGILSPFCSCSIIPVLMGFLSVGVPVSVCLCFLTASSMLNITAIFSLYATMGTQFTIWYAVACLAIIIASSIVFYLIKLDTSISDYHHHAHNEQTAPATLGEHISTAWSCTVNVLKRSAVFILFGVALSSVIMSYMPIDKLSSAINENSILSTALVSLVGIPIHSDIFSIAPLITLFSVLSPSLALAFTVSTMAISLPSIIILSRAIKPKTVLWYCGTIISLTLIVGFLATIIKPM